METIRAESWSHFEQAIKSVREKYGTFKREVSPGNLYERKNLILFRGQANSEWALQTTLERKTKEKLSVNSYMLKVILTQNELESFTGHRWNLPIYPDIEREINEKQDSFRVHLPAYDYLVYLRHHGYPSPLLDWTESPFIAAYFAYINSEDANPAVYCFIERPNSAKGALGGQAAITLQGPYVSTHKRHFAQRAMYTIATEWNYQQTKHYFCSHENVFEKNNSEQDILIKIILPAEARSEALLALSDYNINQFTLFQSEDALVKYLEIKHFDLGLR